MRSKDTPAESANPVLRVAQGELRACGVAAATLAEGEEIAAQVLGIGGDESLATAALLAHAARAGFPLDEDSVPLQFGQPIARTARQLLQLGNVGLPPEWQSGSGFDSAQSEALRKMLLAVAADPRLVVARLAEELVRLRHARALPDAERQRLALGVRHLYAPLANRLGLWTLKWELEDIAFRELEAEHYHRLAKALAEKRVDREQYIHDLCELLRVELARSGIQAQVYGRPKHLYSIWNKMQRKRLSIEQIFDIRALRIVVERVEDCYAALGVVHKLWPFIPGEFDDYIASPKDNNYRSIHTAVSGPAGRSVEIQIRTRDMHQQAELGVAAHWRYKEGGEPDARYAHKIEWARQFLQPGGAAAGDAVESLRREVFADRIYVLTPRGAAIDLPTGGTPLDFAYHLHTDLGHGCRGAKVNGRIVTLNQRLENGDVVEIITGRSGGPSRDWLKAEDGFLASSRSRAKVRAWFRAHESTAAAPANTAGSTHAAAADRAAPRAARRSSRSAVEIEGVGDLLTAMARCCAPVPPEAISGYVTLGRGVTIHRSGCRSLARMLAQHPERALRVSWNLAADALLPATIKAQAFDRNGLLRDISDVLTQARVNIEGVNSHTDPAERIASFEIRALVRDNAQLTQVMKQLRAVNSVFKVERGR